MSKQTDVTWPYMLFSSFLFAPILLVVCCALLPLAAIFHVVMAFVPKAMEKRIKAKMMKFYEDRFGNL